MDINLIGVVYTVFIAQHYMKRNSSPGGKITITASAAALYPMEFAPLYASSKSGVSLPQRSLQFATGSDDDRYPHWCDPWPPG